MFLIAPTMMFRAEVMLFDTKKTMAAPMSITATIEPMMIHCVDWLVFKLSWWMVFAWAVFRSRRVVRPSLAPSATGNNSVNWAIA
jgi:hypothetical protein